MPQKTEAAYDDWLAVARIEVQQDIRAGLLGKARVHKCGE